METYTCPGMPEGYALVKSADLAAATTLMTELECQNANMAADMIRMGNHMDKLMDLYGETVHLIRSANGIFKNLLPHLPAHKYRTVKGELAKAETYTAHILDAADEAQFALEEITDEWAFMSED